MWATITPLAAPTEGAVTAVTRLVSFVLHSLWWCAITVLAVVDNTIVRVFVAWNPATFCNRHSATPDASDNALAAAISDAPLRTLAVRLLELVQHTPLDADTLNAAANHATFFALLPQIFGDAIVPVVTHVLVSTNTLEPLCVIDANVPVVLHRLLHDMWFALLPHTDFKIALARVIARNYVAMLRRPRKESVLEFTVQLFANPVVALVLAKEENLLATQANFIVSVTESHTRVDELSRCRVLDGDSHDEALSRGPIYKALVDMRYLLQVRDVVVWVARGPAWENIVDITSAVHAGVCIMRKLGAHVVYEPLGYKSVLSLEATV